MELKFTNHEDRDFVRKLNKRVSGYFASNDLKKQANAWGWTKAALLLSAYLLSYVGLYYREGFPGLLFCFGMLGVLKIFLALNVAHDAAHQAFASNKQVNQMLLKVFDFLGASSHI